MPCYFPPSLSSCSSRPQLSHHFDVSTLASLKPPPPPHCPPWLSPRLPWSFPCLVFPLVFCLSPSHPPARRFRNLVAPFATPVYHDTSSFSIAAFVNRALPIPNVNRLPSVELCVAPKGLELSSDRCSQCCVGRPQSSPRPPRVSAA